MPAVFAYDQSSLVAGYDYYYYCPESKKANDYVKADDAIHALQCFSFINGFLRGAVALSEAGMVKPNRKQFFRCFYHTIFRVTQINDELLNYLHDHPRMRSVPMPDLIILHTGIGQHFVKCYVSAKHHKFTK